MINFKQLTTVLVMTVSILYGGTVEAKCKQGSHVSHSWIKARYQNCTNCGTKKEKGKTVYYCDCDCPQASKSTPDKKDKGTTTSTSGKKSCSSKEYLLDNKCTACPANATCDGKTFTCGNTFKKSKNSCVCGSDLLYVPSSSGGIGKCVSCPANGTCNGTRVLTCKSGYTKSDNKCVKKLDSNNKTTEKKSETSSKKSCSSKEYLLDNKCTACPANATCDGKTFTCGSTFKKSKNSCVCGSDMLYIPSSSGGIGKCVSCPANGTCNGTRVLTCKSGYTKSDNKCVKKSDSNNKTGEKKETTTSTTEKKSETSGKKSCSSKEYLLDNKCTACPANATCDGKMFTCGNTFKKSKNSCVCGGDMLYVPSSSGGIGKCVSCPANGTCNGTRVLTCKSGYTKSGNTCVKKSCSSKEYLLDNKCTACPANATCDGKTFTCGNTFKKSKNNCVCGSDMLYIPSSSGGIGKCVSCPANGTCNGSRVFTCKDGYTKSGNTCVKKTSSKNSTASSSLANKCKYTSNMWAPDFKPNWGLEILKKDHKNCTNCSVSNKVTTCYCTCDEWDIPESKYITCKKNEVHTNTNTGHRETDCHQCPMHTICNGTAKVKCEVGYTVAEGTSYTTLYKKNGGHTVFGLGFETCELAKCPANTKCSPRTYKGKTYYWFSGCKKGYYELVDSNGKDLEVCGKCPKEGDCSSGNLTCREGYARYRNTCLKCPENASRCGMDRDTDKFGWVDCKNGYVKYNNTCKKCPEGAESCHIDSKGEINYVDCGKEYFKPQNSEGKILAKCLKCPEGGSCSGYSLSCKTGYYKYNNTCNKCPENASSCGADSKTGVINRVSCEKGYFQPKDSGGKRLLKCLKCPEGGSCDGYSLSCRRGYYEYSNTCNKCPENASECRADSKTGAISYVDCEKGYAKYNNTCKKCPENASSCGVDSKTGVISYVSCQAGYHYPLMKNGKKDQMRCVKNGECETQNPC